MNRYACANVFPFFATSADKSSVKVDMTSNILHLFRYKNNRVVLAFCLLTSLDGHTGEKYFLASETAENSKLYHFRRLKTARTILTLGIKDGLLKIHANLSLLFINSLSNAVEKQ